MEATLVYPHQLFQDGPAINKNRRIYLIEEPLIMGEFPIHAHKMLFHRLSVQAYKQELEDAGYDVRHITRESISQTKDTFDILKQDGVRHIHVVDTTDYWLEKRINKTVETHNFEITRYESPLFMLTKQEAIDRFISSGKHMAKFYKQIRIDKDVLMNGTEPLGDTWSFDEDNQKKIPKDHTLPGDIEFITNKEVDTAITWLESLEDLTLYGDKQVWIPYTRVDAQKWFLDFLKYRFENFGSYEDAIRDDHTRLYHSILSPLINSGLLNPQYVINESITYAHDHNIPINSLEGFIRQIIGWREFIRASYEHEGHITRNKNFFNHTRTLDDRWWKGTTGIDPVDDVITRALTFGYTHHIERLMVVGNVMLLSQIHPDEVYTWFMAMYVDAYDWVMVPNVYSMSQFADGGSFATKPYIAGANYIKKMSNYKKGPWEDTLTGLYWNFINTHKPVFAANHRMSMMPRLLEKMDDEKRSMHIDNAKFFLDRI